MQSDMAQALCAPVLRVLGNELMANNTNAKTSNPITVEDNTELVASVRDLAKAMRADAQIWSIFERVTDKLEMTDEEMGALSIFSAEYYASRGLQRPLSSAVASPVLRMVASGNAESLDSENVTAYLKNLCWLI